MSIQDTDKVDLIGTDINTGKVVLTISDHLDWEDEQGHLIALQSKLNKYIEFIESGQIEEDFPDSTQAKGLLIEIISQYNYPEIGKEFLKKVEPIIESIGAQIIQTTSKYYKPET